MSVITISRMFGSGGSEIASRLAHELGWQLFDNDLVDAVARRLGVTAEEVAAREERVPSLVQRLADALTLSSPEALPPATTGPLPPSEEQIVEMTTRVIGEGIAGGHSVVVGRGAQSMLAERRDVMHVFCYAPRSALISRTSDRLGITAEEAGKLVDDTNRQREQYVRRHWARSWRGVENYHLALDTEWHGIDGAVSLIAALARRLPASDDTP
jgi:CMP/dCMP kinase